MKNFLLLLIGVLLFAVSCQDKNLVNENTPNDNHDLLEKCIKNYIHYDATNVAIPVTLKSNGTDVAKKIIFHTSSGTMKVISNDCDCGQLSPPRSPTTPQTWNCFDQHIAVESIERPFIAASWPPA